MLDAAEEMESQYLHPVGKNLKNKATRLQVVMITALNTWMEKR